jgi:hypothetical protein
MKKKSYSFIFKAIKNEYREVGKRLRAASIDFIKDALSYYDIESIELDTEKEGECISVPFSDSGELLIVSYVSMNKNGNVVVGSIDLNHETSLDYLDNEAVSDVADAIYSHLANNDLI